MLPAMSREQPAPVTLIVTLMSLAGHADPVASPVTVNPQVPIRVNVMDPKTKGSLHPLEVNAVTSAALTPYARLTPELPGARSVVASSFLVALR